MDGYQPDTASSPGETIADILKERGMSQGQFSRLMGMHAWEVHDLLFGKTTVTADVAARLEKAFGVAADFWLRRESLYRQDLVRIAGR